jgi:hypothetical protein
VVVAGTRNPPKPASVAREELAGMTQEGQGAAAAHDEHEDE